VAVKVADLPASLSLRTPSNCIILERGGTTPTAPAQQGCGEVKNTILYKRNLQFSLLAKTSIKSLACMSVIKPIILSEPTLI
jgi:hypothetical protein